MNDRDLVPSNPAISRRRFLEGSALVGVAAFLAACGTKPLASAAPTTAPTTPAGSPTPLPTPGPSVAPTPAATPAATASAELNWANWCCYLDRDPADAAKWKTLEDFTAKFGTKVHYEEAIDGNEDFVGTIKDALTQGQDPTWDIVVLTDWMAAKVIGRGWAEEFDLRNMPNFVANVRDVYRGLPWDPEMKHHAPWQTGLTGIGYDPTVTGPITSAKALITVDPRWKGKTEYLTEMRDAVGLIMLALGLDPTAPTRAGLDAAVEAMQKAKSDGIIRNVLGNAYTEDLKSGDAVLAMAWSGDIVTTKPDRPSLEFVFPEEGVMLWTDNCLIPKGAVHKGTAELMIDYCYVPKNAAQIQSDVVYISPVKGVQEIFQVDKPELASDPLRFPTAEQASRFKPFGILTEDDESYFNEQFAKVIGV